MRTIAFVLWLLPVLAIVGSSISPKEVTNQYCGLDAAGKRLNGDSYNEIDKLVSWDEEPGWDSATIIKKYHIVRQQVNQGVATVTVQYDILGYAEGDEWVPAVESKRNDEEYPKREVVSFSLTLKDGRWLITEPVIRPHIRVAPFLAHMKMILDREGVQDRPQLAKMLDQLRKLA